MQEKDLTYSEILYLFAQNYVPEGSMLQSKEETPNGKKLNMVKLGDLIAEAAFANLFINGYIELKLESKKFLGLIPKKVVISNKKSSGEGLSSLEKSIFELSDGAEASNILYRIIGDECSVPWSVIVNIVKESLVSKGFLTKEEIKKKIIVSFVSYKYHLNPGATDNLEKEVQSLNEKLKEFSRQDFYKSLVSSIHSGINAQKEKPDTSD